MDLSVITDILDSAPRDKEFYTAIALTSAAGIKLAAYYEENYGE